MNKTKKVLSLFLLINMLIIPIEPIQAKAFDIYDRSGDLTPLGLGLCAVGAVATTAFVYDLYKTYGVLQEDREKGEVTFTENFLNNVSIVAQGTHEYLNSPDHMYQWVGLYVGIPFGIASGYVNKYISDQVNVEPMKVEVFHPGQIKTKMKDVAGLDQAKEDFKVILDYLKHPEKYEKMGAPAPKGVLMYGGPGNGKTWLARAVAGEGEDCSFISVTGSSFIEMYVGVGAARVRELFTLAKSQGRPCVIFIDEIDALIGKRHDGNSEHNQTVNAFLAEVDGLGESNYPIIVIGATNRLDAIDRPAMRSGRFDRHVEITKPQTRDRAILLDLKLKKIKHDNKIDIQEIAKMTSGFSGADLANLMNQAACIAVTDSAESMSMSHVYKAFNQMKGSMATTVDASYQLDITYPGDVKTTFEDIAGLTQAKVDAQEFIDYLKDSSKYDNMGIKPTKGIMLDGPPGNGKTLLARAIAGEANCPFISVTGSSFVEKYVGTGPARIRELFEKARKEAQQYGACIIFIDEIDSLLSKRSYGSESGGQDERNSTINEFLAQVDGLKTNTKPVIIIGATNHLKALDDGAIRPGRFDKKIHIANPNAQDRLEILQLKLKDIPFDNSMNLKQIARATHGYSGAELTNLINEAALLAKKSDSKFVAINHIEQAVENVNLGLEIADFVFDADDKIIAAYRKAGHVIGLIAGNKDIVNKVSIRPRMNSLGFVHATPVKESLLYQNSKVRTDIRMLFCEQIAEKQVAKGDDADQSTDFEKARILAQNMIKTYGIPDKYARNNNNKLKDVNEVVQDILDEEFKKADGIIKNSKKDLDKIALALQDQETLSGSEIYTLLGKIEPTDLK